jgi:hypothetical protein
MGEYGSCVVERAINPAEITDKLCQPSQITDNLWLLELKNMKKTSLLFKPEMGLLSDKLWVIGVTKIGLIHSAFCF